MILKKLLIIEIDMVSNQFIIVYKKFYFASEQKAIISNKSFKNINHHCIYEYFSFQNILTDNTFLKDIKLLNQEVI